MRGALVRGGLVRGALLRLTRSAFLILLALADRDRHGLGIASEVESVDGAGQRLGPGVLYTTLKRLLDAGLVQEAEPPSGADTRRRYYSLSSAGRRRLVTEARNWQRVVELAHAKKLLDESVP